MTKETVTFQIEKEALMAILDLVEDPNQSFPTMDAASDFFEVHWDMFESLAKEAKSRGYVSSHEEEEEDDSYDDDDDEDEDEDEEDEDDDDDEDPEDFCNFCGVLLVDGACKYDHTPDQI